jgi:hypothetical protein
VVNQRVADGSPPTAPRRRDAPGHRCAPPTPLALRQQRGGGPYIPITPLNARQTGSLLLSGVPSGYALPFDSTSSDATRARMEKNLTVPQRCTGMRRSHEGGRSPRQSG